MVGCGYPAAQKSEPLPVETEKVVMLAVTPFSTQTGIVITARPTTTQAATIAATMTSDPQTVWQLCSPLADHEIGSLPQIVSSPYDPPPMGKDDRHQGVDFAYYNQGGRASIQGEGVTAILEGWVAAVIIDRLPYGNSVILETPGSELPPELIDDLDIEDGESLYHLYAHFEESPLPKFGSRVECGAMLGFVGATGYNIPVAHLHLETRIGPSGARFAEMAFYDSRATDQEMESYKLWRMSGVFQHFDPMRLFLQNEN